MTTGHTSLEVFARCVAAIKGHKLIHRESRQDKEFHFQNWFKARLGETGLHFEVGGRNTYPEFSPPVSVLILGFAPRATS